MGIGMPGAEVSDVLPDRTGSNQEPWPTPRQELVLRAALCQGAVAADAWRAWQADEQLDHGVYRLLPLVYRNLKEQGIDDPWLPRLKGIYRRTWSENQLFLRRTTTVLAAFQRHGIQTMILKGLALSLLYYKDEGVRPMRDVDVLTPTAQARQAIRALSDEGFHPSPQYYLPFKESYLAAWHGYPFTNAAGMDIDLHWHLLEEDCHPDADDDFWAAATPTTVKGVPTHALDPADQLLHVCIHGVRWNPVPSVRWVADAMTILRVTPDLGWDRLVDQAQRRRLVVLLRAGLNYLQRRFDAPIPQRVLDTLANTPTSWAERREYAATTQAWDTAGPVTRFWHRYQRYWRVARPKYIWQQPTGFVRYLQAMWGVDSLLDVPRFAFEDVSRRLRKRPL